MAVTTPLTTLDKALLTELEQAFPLEHRPFQTLGQRLNVSEQACLEGVGRLKRDGAIARLSAVFDPTRLGYQRGLVALRVDPDRVEAAGRVLAAHTAIAYLARRDGPIALWATVMVPPGSPPDALAEVLRARAGAADALWLPALRIYKAKVADTPDLTDSELLERQESLPRERWGSPAVPSLSARDVQLIRRVQEDLPLMELPFNVWAAEEQMSEEELLAWMSQARRDGRLMRFGAIRSSKGEVGPLDITVVWQVPDGRVDAVGEELSRFRDVRHCSRRPIGPAWPYALLTVLQARTAGACADLVRRIQERLGPLPHQVLATTHELKRTPIRYFPAERHGE